MARIIYEDDIEKSTIQRLLENNNYDNHIDCFTADKKTLPDGSSRANKKQVLLTNILLNKLIDLNPNIPLDNIKSVCDQLIETPKQVDMMTRNYENYNLLKNGVKIEFDVQGVKESNYVKLIDFDNPLNNDFTIVSQLWIEGITYWRRPDIIVFINGLPLVFIELKNSNILVKNAFDKNLKDYIKDIPYLFHYNQICVLSNAVETRVGSFMSGYEHFFEWLRDNEKDKPDRQTIKEQGISIVYLIDSLLKKDKLIDYIENFILYDRQKTKIIAKNHQYIGVNNAYNAFLNRENLKGKLGVFWHTQGSGKSYSMAMFAKKIRRKCAGNFTFLIVTDRKDLDGQIYKNFVRTEFISKEEEVKPKNSTKLREMLSTNTTVVFTLIHKFRYDKGKKYPVLSERDDIVVIVDEAHRTQYKDLAENMRIGLPNAQYIAFTGTPLLGSKRLTNKWFGDYVSEYNFAQSIEDNSTVPLYYSKRVEEVEIVNPYLDDDFLDILEQDNLSGEEQKRLENYYAKELEVLKRDDRLEKVAKDIVYHFPNRGFLGKAMVISVDKFTAVKMYDKVNYYWKEQIKNLNKEIKTVSSKEERDEIKSKIEYMRSIEMAVVVSEEDGEETKFNDAGLTIKPHRKRMEVVDENGFDIEDNFKDPTHRLQLVFVCSMWLTGFDAPSVSTLYLDKPMKNHTLMQAIARANRVFPNKKNGMVVDYVNVFKNLERALADYANTTKDDEMPVENSEELLENLNKTIDLTTYFCKEHDIDLNSILLETDTFDKLELFNGYADKLLSNDEIKNQYKVYSNTVELIYESSKPEIFNMDFEPKMKEAILYLRDVMLGKIRPEKLDEAKKKVDDLLDTSVTVVKEDTGSYAIVKVDKQIDLSMINFDELRDRFKKTKYKHLEIADLRDFIQKKLEKMLKKNSTRTDFAERFQNIIDNYNAGSTENEEFYELLIKFMEELKIEEERHIREDLSEEQLELFDLLLKANLTKEEEKQVKLAAKNLYETLSSKKEELFVVGWEEDSKPKEKVKHEITKILDKFLPISYDRPIFNEKSDMIYRHIIDKAIIGEMWVA